MLTYSLVLIAGLIAGTVSGALPADIVVKGVSTGSALMVGAFATRNVVLKLSPNFFRLLIDGLLMFYGVTMLWIASR